VLREGTGSQYYELCKERGVDVRMRVGDVAVSTRQWRRSG
jgi:hypothetical protein